MTVKRFDHPNTKLKGMRGHNGVQLPDGKTIDDVCDELYNRVGATWPVDWEPWSPAEPKFDTDNLPSGVSESDVETALTNMVNDGWL